MAQRLHAWMYSLLYPTLLGVFLVALIAKDGKEGYCPWGILLAIYFSFQHIEGAIDEASYSLGRFGRDVLEMALMTFAFVKLYPGELPPVDAMVSRVPFPFILMLAFLVPPLFRWRMEPDKFAGDHVAFYKALSRLSLLAAVFAGAWLLGAPQGGAFWLILSLLAIYGLGFVIFNDWAAGYKLAPKRPTPPSG